MSKPDLLLGSLAAGAVSATLIALAVVAKTTLGAWSPVGAIMNALLALGIVFAISFAGALVLGWVAERLPMAARRPRARSLVLFATGGLAAGFVFSAGGLAMECGMRVGTVNGGLVLGCTQMLTAEDSSGMLIDEAEITAHGWEMILRYSLLAGGVGLLMGGAFGAAAYRRAPMPVAPA